MRSLEELDLVPAWVNPDHLVATAVHVMQGHSISAVAVIEGRELQGMVTLERASAMPKFARVDTILQPVRLSLQDSISVRAAAKEFIDRDALFAAVFRGEEFVGLLSSNMLLEEVGRSWDPLTNLPWSNGLREWGSDLLQHGTEIALVFVDVDDFGDYNKRHGHVVGDAILKLVADRLRTTVDRYSDVLVRYGGDEFVIGTRLDRMSAEKKFGLIEEFQVTLPEVPDPVTVTVGFSGGLRSNGRVNVHTASTLDNLISLASQDCMKKKSAKSSRPIKIEILPEKPAHRAPAATTAKPAQKEELFADRFEVRLVSVDEEEPSRPVAVTVRLDGQDGTGAAMPSGMGLQMAVAEATCSAIRRIVPSVRPSVSKTVVDSGPDGEKVVTVVGSCTSDAGQQAMAGSSKVSRNVYRAVAEAVVNAYLSSMSP